MDLFEVRRTAVELLALHGLPHWRVVFDRAKTRAGQCRFDTREISLSAPLMRLQEAPEVRETILHEIAHALVGPHHQHDEVWRRTAQRIGASGERMLRTHAVVTPEWTGICPNGHVAHRHRRPAKPISCGECAPEFSIGALLTWRYKGRSVPMTSAYRAAVAAARARGTESGERGA